MKLEPILLVQMNTFERNADKKDLSWPSFGDGRQVLGKRQVSVMDDKFSGSGKFR